MALPSVRCQVGMPCSTAGMDRYAGPQLLAVCSRHVIHPCAIGLPWRQARRHACACMLAWLVRGSSGQSCSVSWGSMSVPRQIRGSTKFCRQRLRRASAPACPEAAAICTHSGQTGARAVMDGAANSASRTRAEGGTFVHARCQSLQLCSATRSLARLRLFPKQSCCSISRSSAECSGKGGRLQPAS